MFSASPPGSLTVSSLIPSRFEGQLAVKAVVAACRGAGTTFGGTEFLPVDWVTVILERVPKKSVTLVLLLGLL